MNTERNTGEGVNPLQQLIVETKGDQRRFTRFVLRTPRFASGSREHPRNLDYHRVPWDSPGLCQLLCP